MPKQLLPSKKILAICMLDSIHTARWLEQFKESDLEFHLLASTPNRIIHSWLIDLTLKEPEKYKIHFSQFKLPIFFWGIDLVLRNKLRALLASKLVKKYDLDTIHAIELNHAGYIAKNLPLVHNQKSLKLICSVWGSDIYWFGRFAKHKKQLSELLSEVDLLVSECQRDFTLATNLGFSGRFIQSPSLFGFSESELNKEKCKPSERKIILVKGYESFAGRASLALKAIEQISNKIDGFEVVVYSANWKTRRIVKRINKTFKVPIKVHKKKTLSSSQMLELFRNSRIHLGISLSDGVPASILECLVSGAFPIQTNTSCADQWIDHGKSGFLIDPNLDQIKQAVLQAVNDDELVDNAMVINQENARKKLKKEFVAQRIFQVYQ